MPFKCVVFKLAEPWGNVSDNYTSMIASDVNNANVITITIDTDLAGPNIVL